MMKLGMAALLAAASVSAAQAAIVIDQSALVAPAQSYRANSAGVIRFPNGTNGFNQLVQTVTAGVGGRLAGIDLQLARGQGTGFVNFFLFAGDGTIPGTQVAYTTGIALADLPASPALAVNNLYAVDVSAANFQVAPGQLFSFGIGPSNPLNQPGSVSLLTGSGPAGSPPPPNVYPFGTLSVTANGVSYVPAAGDGGFQTRVDTAAATPEPAAWLMLIAGFGAAGGALRRRKEPAAA